MKLQMILVASAIMWMPGCASSTRGADQRIIVSTPGAPGATCSLNIGGQNRQNFTTPVAIVIPEFSGPVIIKCSKKCFHAKEKSFSSNINGGDMSTVGLFGDIEFLAVNLVTQQKYNYSHDFIIPMRPDNLCRSKENGLLDGDPNDFNNKIDDFSYDQGFDPQINSRSGYAQVLKNISPSQKSIK